MTIQEFVTAAAAREDLTSIRLCSAIVEDGQRTKGATKGAPLSGSVDEIVAAIEAAIVDAKRNQRFEVRATFVALPTERFAIAP
jgi:hypothetical protein